MRSSGPAATGALEGLAAVACIVRNGIARQPAPDGVLPLRKPDLSTAHAPNHLQGDWADSGARFYVAAVQRLPLDRLVLDGWICHGIDIAANGAGKCGVIFCALLVLPGKVPRGVAFAVLPASLFAACGLGSLPRTANCADPIQIGTSPGGRHHPAHDSHMD